jgi:hypothetical protein
MQTEGIYMSKAVVTALCILAITFSTGVAAQPLKQGTTSGTYSHSGTFQALAMGNEHVQINYEDWGVRQEDQKSTFPAQAAASRCLGSYHARQGAVDNHSGFCVGIDADGDQWFFTYQAAWTVESAQTGTFTYVGGTGKYQGISGRGTFTYQPLRPISADSFQGMSIYKGDWKLP